MATPCSSDLLALLLDPGPLTSPHHTAVRIKRAEHTCALLFRRWCETCWETHFALDFCSGRSFW